MVDRLPNHCYLTGVRVAIASKRAYIIDSFFTVPRRRNMPFISAGHMHAQ